MVNLILSSLYFILPAYVANMFPVIFKWLPFDMPINEKLFGAHKTWRGFALGFLGALLTLFLQLKLQQSGILPLSENPISGAVLSPGITSSGIIHGSSILGSNSAMSTGANLVIPLINYESINLFLYAFLFGIGALTGDLIKSFFKRRIGIAPGKPLPIFDQLDFIIGALLFLSPFFIPPWQVILVIIILTPLLHLLTNTIAYLIGLKKVWW